MQGLVTKLPVPLLVKETEPEGPVAPVEDVSVTVPVQVAATFTLTEDAEQETLVLVECST